MRLPIALLSLALVAAPAAAQVPDIGDVVADAMKAARSHAGWTMRVQDVREGPETTERFSKRVPIGPTGAFELSNVAGDITVTGGGGTDVTIDAVKRVRSRDAADAKRMLAELTIEVDERPSRVEVRTVYPRLSHVSGAVDFTIALPSGASASIRSVSGDVTVTSVKGEVRVASVSGTVTTSGTSRLGEVKSVSGDVRVSDATGDLGLVAETVSGTLTLRRVKARDLDLNTVSGDMRIEADSARVRARTVSGEVEFTGGLARSGRYEFTTHSGDVRLLLTNDTGFEVEARTFSGDLRTTMPLTERAGRDDEDRGRRRRQTLRGTVGDGSAVLELRTFSGDVTIGRK